ncbi:uncharacterized protein EDB93DRAFT_1223264 [Suillus bovinus]|uniref:uncharacterized protein n=1 Tax=Suillus bovinus TaxID=48563 RepID=UPI001B85D20D|nr:uncharacterized protein EDB93DRAFT_1223264 [Suillus bovinus]KAG2154425.1 hypothetical protein EDB93DRAFT_1223264 [Suillus bovinus]
MAPSAQAEKRLLWHPRWENKFMVGGGSQMTMYEWAPEDSEIRHVTSQNDLQFMKCFAWSPDPAFDDLFAVGSASGRVDLIRLEATKVARNNVLSSGPVVTLPVRNTRSCNALAFCNADPNYLAVGLDKVRGDSSLIIWDIQSATPLLSLSKPTTSNITEDAVEARPQPRIARAEVGHHRTDGRVLQQHAPTEVVSALAFLPQSTHMLLAGISARWLRLFDLRSAVPATTNVATKVYGIATSPIDPHQIACCGDGIITVWDARRLLHPLLMFTEKDAAADGARPRAGSGSFVDHIEFSSSRRGVLAAHEKDSSYVRFWDLQQAQGSENNSDEERSMESSQTRAAKRSWAPWTAGSAGAGNGNGMKIGNVELQEALAIVLSDTRKTTSFRKPLASFALVPSKRAFSLTSEVMVVNKDGDLELYAVHDTPKQASWSPRGDLIIGAGLGCKMFPGFEDRGTPPQPWDIHVEETTASRGRDRTTSLPAFGRGDEDGFPALEVKSALSKPIKARTYSPASFRHYPLDQSELSVPSSSAGAQMASRAEAVEEPKSNGHRQGGKKSAPGGKTLRSVHQAVEDDISMIMRRRTIRGYGLASAKHNAQVVQGDPCSNTMLSELWDWIHHSRELVCSPTSRLHGYEFSNQGLFGLWEGFAPLPQVSESSASSFSVLDGLLTIPQISPGDSSLSPLSTPAVLDPLARLRQPPDDLAYGDFTTAVAALCARQTSGSGRPWKPPVRSTEKLEQRQFALHLCGWGIGEEEMNREIRRWEKEGQQPRAACWLVFTRQYQKALELLMRSKDEMHNLVSGTLAALVPSAGSTLSNELRVHAERLIVRLEDPYFRAMLTQLISKDWSKVLEEGSLPLRERLVIAFQFLEDEALSSYLTRTTDQACTRGDIEGLIITGLTPSGMDILQSYVDSTGDAQTAAILVSHVCPAKFIDARAERWLDTYRDLLDGFKLFHHRVAFDVERGRILQEAVLNGDLAPFDWAPKQILIRCNYCSKPMNPVLGETQKGRPTACPHCSRALPRCSVCLMTLSIVPDCTRDAGLAQSQATYQDTIDDAIVICQTCRHGGHASHILDWFFGEDGARSRGMCPVADCDCHCADEF